MPLPQRKIFIMQWLSLITQGRQRYAHRNSEQNQPNTGPGELELTASLGGTLFLLC
jgi:hypothetical protein